jgi:hypothetical protein
LSRRRSKAQKTARIHHLHKALSSHDEEIAQKMALVLQEFHLKYLTPLEQRVAFLELPFYKRWWIKWQHYVLMGLRWFRVKVAGGGARKREG